MTPGELATYCRQRYNAVSDDFFSDSELYTYMWQAQNELALYAKVIERVLSSTTTASTQSYSFPTDVISIKRLECNGVKLQPITMRQDDIITIQNTLTTQTGSPAYYYVWNKVIYLRPIPDSAYTLSIYAFKKPQQVSSTATLDVPEEYHLDLADFVLAQMATKDKNYEAADRYEARWNARKREIRAQKRLSLRGDGPTEVQGEDGFPMTMLGST